LDRVTGCAQCDDSSVGYAVWSTSCALFGRFGELDRLALSFAPCFVVVVGSGGRVSRRKCCTASRTIRATLSISAARYLRNRRIEPPPGGMIALADPAGGCRTRGTNDHRSRSPILSEHPLHFQCTDLYLSSNADRLAAQGVTRSHAGSGQWYLQPERTQYSLILR
jgi:hypothetical protein